MGRLEEPLGVSQRDSLAVASGLDEVVAPMQARSASKG
jgi:hypothetical protein